MSQMTFETQDKCRNTVCCWRNGKSLRKSLRIYCIVNLDFFFLLWEVLENRDGGMPLTKWNWTVILKKEVGIRSPRAQIILDCEKWRVFHIHVYNQQSRVACIHRFSDFATMWTSRCDFYFSKEVNNFYLSSRKKINQINPNNNNNNKTQQKPISLVAKKSGDSKC